MRSGADTVRTTPCQATFPHAWTRTLDSWATRGCATATSAKCTSPYLWPQDRHYAYITYTDEETEELSILSTEIFNHVQGSIARWITRGGVDEEWDAYLAELDRLNLDRAMEIFQTAYDRFHGN